ncbi:MAG: DUF4258 domain-containing protein [Promethearchaeota archaeon]
MPIIFTKHALERLRTRDISKEEVYDTVNNPDDILDDLFGNMIAQKIIRNYLLRVFYHKEGKSKVVLTAYKTSKIDKYT